MTIQHEYYLLQHHPPKLNLFQIYHQQLQEIDIPEDQIILINNPPGFFLASQRPSVVIPHGDVDTLLNVAGLYHASYIILELNHPRDLNELYLHPDNAVGLDLLWSDGQTHIFFVEELGQP